MRAQTIGWNRSSPATPPPPAEPQGPWAGRLIGVLLLVLALAALYHGTAGQAVWRELTGYVAGGQALGTGRTQARPAAATVAVPESDILAAAAGDVAAAGGEVERGQWRAAAATLGRLENEWLRLSGMLAVDRIPVLDINNFTALLTDTQARVAARDAARARLDMNRLASEFDVLALDFVGTQSPTFVELRDLSDDLSGGVRARDWSRVSADAQALATLVQQIEQGY
ncbi:MAG: hypothetical protein K6V73_02235 [Firmicutes bacterium]|nr:hypothetical protein [Bacillota bacterium]